MDIKILKMEDLARDDLNNIIQRSMEDISAVFEDISKIVDDVRVRGDESLLDSLREFKGDISIEDLEVDKKEIS